MLSIELAVVWIIPQKYILNGANYAQIGLDVTACFSSKSAPEHEIGMMQNNTNTIYFEKLTAKL